MLRNKPQCPLSCFAARWILVLGLVVVCPAAARPGETAAKSRADYARAFKTQLATQILPYWYDTAIDWQRGGYVLSDDAAKKSEPATEKQIVTQARMVWGFSHAHLKGFGDAKRNYLKAAEHGYRFLLDPMFDRQNGGYFWAVDLAGKPVADRKIMYGESFVIYALVEYYRASRDAKALRHAMDLYRVIQQRAYDRQHGGWIEHFTRDWKPILTHDAQILVEVGGCKSANTHLHLMESLAELYEATRDPEVKKSLEEALRLNATYFYPKNAGQSCFHRQLDWKPVTAPSSAGLSYGHNVEFAWLMIRAEEVLARGPSWDHFDAHMKHALQYGYDHERGGLYSRGFNDQPATDTDKVWWVQAEMLAALTDGLKHQENAKNARALESLLAFLVKYQADPKDGIWLESVTAEGKPKSTSKAHNWKANYHDVRAMVKFVEASH